MLCRLTELFTVAKCILQTEGLLALLARGITLLVGHFFQYEIYYLYEIDILKALGQNNHARLIPDPGLESITEPKLFEQGGVYDIVKQSCASSKDHLRCYRPEGDQ